MSSKCESGVFKAENGQWGYRFSILINGKRISRKKLTDEAGNKITSKRAASQAREAAIQQARDEALRQQPIIRKTIQEIFDEYRQTGRNDRAFQTIRKQDSLWDNHLCKRFGKHYVDDISVAEITDYLNELYYINNFSYQYTASFLKMFYLIFGQAYSRNYLHIDNYNKLCVNKNSKIRMPKMKPQDDQSIIAFSNKQLKNLNYYFQNTSAYTAYLLGRYCGLRINECYGLKWSNVNINEGTIFIDRQMQYQEGIIRLVAPKTQNSKNYI